MKYRKQNYRMKRIVAASAALMLAGAVAGLPDRGSAQSAPSWPTFHGNAQRTGVSSTSGPTTNVVANQWQLPKAVASSPVVDAGGTAYVGDDDHKVYALNPSDPNKPKWSFATTAPVQAGPTLSADGKTLYVSSLVGTTYALNTSNGNSIWGPVDVGGSVQGAPLLSNDGSTLYLATTNGSVVALKTSDGSVAWHVNVGAAVRGSLAFSPDGSTIYAATASNTMFGLTTGGSKPGSVTQNFYLDGPGLSTPVVDSNGNIYVTTNTAAGQGVLDSFTATGNTARFAPKVPHNIPFTSSPAIFNGQAFFGDVNGNLYSYNTSSGNQNWQKLLTGGGAVESSPAVTSGNSLIYVGSYNGVHAVDTAGTNEVWFKGTGAAVRTAPAVGPDGSIWVGAESGIVYRFHAVVVPPPPGTPVPGATKTPVPVPTQSGPTGATPVCALAATLKTQVKVGKKQSIKITCTPNTVIHARVNYPNGDHQSKSVTTKANGTVTYTYTQGASKIMHNRLYANVILRAGSGASQVNLTKQYKILFGKIDVSAEPRTQAVGKVINIYVHTSKKTPVVAYLIFPNGNVTKVFGKTGPKGWAHLRYKVVKGKTRGSNHRVHVLAKLASGRPNISNKT